MKKFKPKTLGETGPKNPYYRTQMCKKPGSCTHADCQYAHHESELLVPPYMKYKNTEKDKSASAFDFPGNEAPIKEPKPT